MAWEDEIVGPDVASAGLHISERIGRDAAAQVDLEEAIEASRYASHPYSSHPKEWPPLFEVVDTRELPPVLIERYNAAGGEGTALCGIFLEIRRAWASVDNSIFLWRFDKWDGQCPEYSSQEQAICAVGLVRSKPGIFVEAIQYLLVLATPLELILVGVCCTGRGDGTDQYADVSLQPLPEYTIPSDGVTMTCITCTDKGRIFLAGRDGHIYEMLYTTGSGWNKRCRIVCLTAGFSSILSRWILPNALNFGTVDPAIDMVVDNERKILYARTEDMKLQVFDLGENGDDPLKKIAEERNLVDPRDTQYGIRRSSGLRTVSRASKPSIACISPLSTMESRCLHLLAVLSDGRRLYISTSSSGNTSSVSGFTGISCARQRPCCLKVVASRPSPPVGAGSRIAFGAASLAGQSQPEDLSLKVDTSFYSGGTLVLSDSSPSTMSSLLVVERDSSIQTSPSASLGMHARGTRALRELVTSLPVEGRMLYAADILPQPDTAATIHSLYSDSEPCAFERSRESCEKTAAKLWVKGDLPTQHILPRRRIVVFSTMGMTEVVFNRPVDILRKVFESSSPRTLLEDFFNRFGAAEAAAMCLLLAAKLICSEEHLISNAVAEKAAEAFEDPRIVGMPQLDSSGALSNTRTPPGSFSMGQVVHEAEPVFSGAHEGLCLCSSRLLFPIWEFPVFIVHGKDSSDAHSEGVIVCRLLTEAMSALERKLRSLELFLRSRRNQRRGLYGYVAGLGDHSGFILYGTGSDTGVGWSATPNLLTSHTQIADSPEGTQSSKRQKLPHSTAELAAMEVRAMECLRRLLRRSSEALFLLQVLSQHHVTRLIQNLDANLRHKLVQLTFHQLACSEEGDHIAMRLISGLMEYYIGPDGRGTVDEISVKLRNGCPSYFNESDYKYFLAVECLEKASASVRAEEKDKLARDAFNVLAKIPESADLRTVCKRFEDLRFYEAVVHLPLQKAQSLDPDGDALNERIDAGLRETALSRRRQCYDIIINAIYFLKGVQRRPHMESSTASNLPRATSALDQASQNRYISQIIQLSIQWPDRLFHEYLYDTMIDLGLVHELLEYGGSDLVPFLQSAGHPKEASVSSKTVKYLDILAKYYVSKRQHLLAAHVLYRLAERQCLDLAAGPDLEQRQQYLSQAVLQAKNASNTIATLPTRSISDDGLLDMLEGKLVVLRFQIKIKEMLDGLASRSRDMPSISEPHPTDPFPQTNVLAEENFSKSAREKAQELAIELKSITQLYNEYAVPFELWEICLEMLNFANYSGDADSKIVRETWARLLDQALSRGGIAEAASALKRIGPILYPGDGASIPLDTLCLHLEKAALERSISGHETFGDDDVARALLAACKGSFELLLSIYDQLLSSGAIVSSPNLRLRLLRSVLSILREWAMSAVAQKMGITTSGVSLILGSAVFMEQTTISQGIQDKIISAANRYMTEVRRLSLPQSQTENVYRGFRELEEKLSSPFQY